MKKAILTLLAVLSISFMYAQGRYGADSAECIKYLSFYKQYMKQNNMADAASNWRQAIRLCPPTANQNMLLDGMKILRKEISANMNNPVRKKELVDSLMMLHDMRYETYPKYATPAKINRAMDMINFVEKGGELEAYNVIGEAMELAQAKSPVSIVVRYMNFAVELYKSGKLMEEDVLNAFQKASLTLGMIQKAKPSDMVNSAITDVESMFAQSGVADCEKLVEVFQPRYDAAPTDNSLLSNIVTLFSSTNCTDSDLFRNAVEGLHKTDPSYTSAYLLYKLYSTVPDGVALAEQYMNEAIAYPESDNETDAQYYFELASYYFQKAGKNAEAVEAAKKCAELSETLDAKAYFLIATIWSVTKCPGNEIQSRAPFWVATDYMNKAKKLDPSMEAEANSHIASYAKYFPMQADAFMYDVVDGDSYTVSCNGMRETTRVRTQK